MDLEEIKAYCRIDFDDDDEIITMIYDAVLEEMKDLIAKFDPKSPTARQRLMICILVKDLYDKRDLTTPSKDAVKYAFQSMLLKEMLA